MDNLLAQVTGTKRVVLFSPQDSLHLYLSGQFLFTVFTVLLVQIKPWCHSDRGFANAKKCDLNEICPIR